MNSRQILAAVIFASLLSLTIAAFPDADTSDAAGSPFKFYEVSPENNGFTLKNCSESPSNLKGLAVTDGEGTPETVSGFGHAGNAAQVLVQEVIGREVER